MGCRGPGTHRNKRKRAVRVDCDASGLAELCVGAVVAVVEAIPIIATRAAAGERGGRPGGVHAQFSQVATPEEVGLREERGSAWSGARGLCTIGCPPPESMTVGYTGEHTAMYDNVRRCTTRLGTRLGPGLGHDVRHVWHMRIGLDQRRRGRFIGWRPVITVAGGRGLLGRLAAEITQLLTVVICVTILGNFAAALNGDKS